MLPNLPTYQEIFDEFQWQIPEYFNMGSAVCEKFAENEPERVALIGWNQGDKPETHTYGELHEKSNRLANCLKGRGSRGRGSKGRGSKGRGSKGRGSKSLGPKGLEPGDRVAIILPQSPQTVIAHIAIYKSGAISVPLARLFQPDALAYRLKNSSARIVITNRQGLEKISAIRSELPMLETIIVVDAKGDNGVENKSDGIIDFEDAIRSSNVDFTPENTKSGTPALIIYTSGTTGPPKGALHAHRVLLGHIPGLQVHHEFIPQPGDIAWTPADWAWAGGLLNILLPCLYFGVPVVYGGMDRFDPERAFQLMAETNTTCAFIPPTALRLMKTVEKPAIRHKLRIRTIGSGGESLGRDTCQWARRELGLDINEFYGQTECNLVLSGFAARGISKSGSIGKPVPGHQVCLFNQHGEICQPGEAGEVAVKRPDPVMFLNYWQDEKATAEKFRGDWMMTGDQCKIDSQGYFHFFGRDDDVISSAGYRLGPGEIEDCLVSHPAVKLAAAVGKPDELRGDIIKAYIVLSDEFLPQQGSVELAREIQLHVKQRLAANIYPHEIEVVDEIPLTTTGKVIRRLFRERAIEETK
jgi:acetyl-CoA synthetase